ncbi:MAG TPA: S8 family serine peptidase [Xanthobacteraceae bacterium]|nr:S8 family serine peptidase [Xanthobacteraceae bacterium]
MGSGEERTRTASGRILPPKLLLSAALAALIVAAPTGDRPSALAMNLGSGFGAGRLGAAGTVHLSNVPRGPVGGTAIGNGREVGIVGRGEHGRDLPGNPCKPGRTRLERCVVNTGHPGGEHPGGVYGPRGPILTHVVPANPIIVTTQPPASGIGSQPPVGSGPQTARRTGTGIPPLGERRYAPNEVVVELAAAVSNQQTDALARRHRLRRLQSAAFQLGGTTLVRWRITDRRSVPAVVRDLETDATVLSAQPNYLFALQDQTAIPAAPSEGDPAQYILDKMHLPQAHELAKGKVLVAVIDSGVDIKHPDLAGDIAGTFDALGTGLKPHAHGTAIAGAIAAHGRLMGAAPAAQILAVRAFSGDGGPDDGNTFAIMTGMDWAVSHGARVINMSFAGPQDPGITRSIAAAHDRGVVLVAAAGNKGAKSPPLFPAADSNVIAVTATDADDQLPAFANRGPYVAVAAPGVDLMLLAPAGTLQFSSGTSFSAAYVTGTAALMLERRPDLGPETLRRALTETAHHLGAGSLGRAADKAADGSGVGLVDAYQAVLSLMPAPLDAAASVLPAAVRR